MPGRTGTSSADIVEINSLSDKEFKERMDKAIKESRLFTRAEIGRIMADASDKDRDKMDKVAHKDYSHFEKMSRLTRNAMASQFILDNPELFSGDVTSALGYISGKQNETGDNWQQHPLLRLGVSLQMRNPEKAELAKELDMKLNTLVMVDTLEPVTGEAKATIESLYGDKAADVLSENLAKQKVMAKTLLMAQLGGLTVETGDKQALWKGDVANAFAHCSRVCVSMPGGKDKQSELYASLLGSKLGDNSGVMKTRTAATHSVNRSEIATGTRLKENKHKISCFSDQYGMNVAIGGLGKNGISGANASKRALLGDGSCGHMYMHIEPGDEAHYGGMLIGFESDSAGVTNQMGHTHDILATGEKASSFGGQRDDEIGNKYGGRDIDLRSFDAAELVEIFDAFDKKIGDYSDPSIRPIMEQLCGEPMDAERMTQLLVDIGLRHDRAKELAEKNLAPVMTAHDKEEMTTLFEMAKSGMEATGEKMNSYEQENIADSYKDAIAALPGDKRDLVENLLKTYESCGQLHAQELEAAERLGFVVRASSLLNDPNATTRVRRNGLNMQKAAIERQQNAARLEKEAKQFVENIVKGEETAEMLVQAAQFIDQNAAIKPADNLTKSVMGDVKTGYSQDQFKQFVTKMESNKRSFMGIGLSNSEEYEQVISALHTIDELHGKEVTPENAKLMARSYNALVEACEDYIDKHGEPRTKSGQERLKTIKELSEFAKDTSFDSAKSEKLAQEFAGKKWKDVPYTENMASKDVKQAVSKLESNDLLPTVKAVQDKSKFKEELDQIMQAKVAEAKDAEAGKTDLSRQKARQREASSLEELAADSKATVRKPLAKRTPEKSAERKVPTKPLPQIPQGPHK